MPRGLLTLPIIRQERLQPTIRQRVLQQLAESHGNIALVHQALGDAFRRLERYDEATQAYDRAIALYSEPARQHWIIYFARGITHERTDRWPLAKPISGWR